MFVVLEQQCNWASVALLPSVFFTNFGMWSLYYILQQLVNCYTTAAWISFTQYRSAGIKTLQTSILWMFGHYLVFVLVWSWFCQSILAPYWCKTRQEVFEIANTVLCISQICTASTALHCLYSKTQLMLNSAIWTMNIRHAMMGKNLNQKQW